MDMTLCEIYNVFGISRRAIQGYEKAGLVSRSGKNNRGHLLYDEHSQERIKRIKLFQQMGFSIKEITGIIDAPKDVLKPVLERQIKKLKGEEEELKKLIDQIYELMETL